MESEYLEDLVNAVLHLKSKKEVLDFLYGILTPQELEQIAKRLQIVKKLKQGITQREIAEALGVGIGTVTRGSRELRKGRFANIKV